MRTANEPLLSVPENGDVSAVPGRHLPPVVRQIWNFIMYKSPKPKAQGCESLDYEPIQNDLSMGRMIARRGGKRRWHGCVVYCSELILYYLFFV
jgi:hypothetical protein